MLNEELPSGDFKKNLPFTNCKLNNFSCLTPKKHHSLGVFLKLFVVFKSKLLCIFWVAKWQWKWSCKPPRYWRLFSKGPRHPSNSNHQKWIRKVSTCCPQHHREFWVSQVGWWTGKDMEISWNLGFFLHFISEQEFWVAPFFAWKNVQSSYWESFP